MINYAGQNQINVKCSYLESNCPSFWKKPDIIDIYKFLVCIKVGFFNQLFLQNCLSCKLPMCSSIAIYFQFTIFNHPTKINLSKNEYFLIKSFLCLEIFREKFNVSLDWNCAHTSLGLPYFESYMQRGIHKVCGFVARMQARSTGYPALRFLTKARLYSLEDKGLARVSGTDCTALSTDRTMNFVYFKKRKEIPLRRSQTPRGERYIFHICVN